MAGEGGHSEMWNEINRIKESHNRFGVKLAETIAKTSQCEKDKERHSDTIRSVSNKVTNHGEMIVGMKTNLDALVEIEKSRTMKLIAIVGIVCTVVTLAVELIFKFWDKK